MSGNCDKNPAAVALGKRRQAQMTADERRAFVTAGGYATAELKRKFTPEERRRIARQAAMTRRRTPRWMQAAAPAVNIERPPTTDELARLEHAIADLPDDVLARMVAAIEEQFTGS